MLGNDYRAKLVKLKLKKFFKMRLLFSNNNGFSNSVDKIILPITKGLEILTVKDIVRCEASRNYTNVFFDNNTCILSSKTLNKFEKILSDANFVRIHNKHLVNLKYVKRYKNGKSGHVILDCGHSLEVSEGRKVHFLKNLKTYAKTIV